MCECDRPTFDALFRRTYPKLYFYALSLLADESDADDVVEEVFVDLWRRRDVIDFGEHIDIFLYRAVYTRSVNVLRRRNVNANRLSALDTINSHRMNYLATLSSDPLRERLGKCLTPMVVFFVSVLRCFSC